MATIELDELKRAHRATWRAGDYAAVSDAITDVVAPRHLLDEVDVEPGQTVLDVATGTGNIALAAAAAGARVTGLDLTGELLETAGRRAAAAGLDVEWVEGDAEALPFARGRFDSVLSAFGVQFAPRHEVAAAELCRVCRPGGTIGLVNWTPEGTIGEMFRILGGYLPPLPAYASAPARWGSEGHVRALFGVAAADLRVVHGTTPLRNSSADGYVRFMETRYGPMIKAREKLAGQGQWDACRGELVAMMERRNEATDGSLLVPAEYAIVVVRRA